MKIPAITALLSIGVLLTPSLTFAQSADLIQERNVQIMADELTELGFVLSPSSLDEGKFDEYLRQARELDAAMNEDLGVMTQQLAPRLAELSSAQGSKKDIDKKQRELTHEINAETAAIVNKYRDLKRYLLLRTFKD